MASTILTINSGSSSLKASLFRADGTRSNHRYEHIGHGFPHDHGEAFDALIRDLDGTVPDVVGHRFVHGGDIDDAARLVDEAERLRLETITHLAPLHMPGNLLGVDLCRERFNVPQVACFDTAFHATLPELAWRLPIPNELGLRRYGFHGLNYAHVARTLPGILGDAACGRVVVAHLGAGASLCLLENLKSVDTTMGYTPAGGIPMGTRGGDLDPGIMLELAKRYDAAELADLVYHRMGLIALSNGEGSEMSDLLESRTPSANFAVEYFCRQVRAAIGAFAAKAGGIDALVFSGGIGEHASLIRFMICEPLKFLGFKLNHHANLDHDVILNTQDSRPVLIIAADEEGMIRDLVRDFPG
ncbi:MAG TPA: acetate kinase [Sulfuricella sp.]|nr:acetate kinase [Sulfuricella sp.]